nr:thermonuclease family protein [Oculatella sp. LEGE 06141]
MLRNWGLGISGLILGCILLLGGCQTATVPPGKPVVVSRVTSGQTLEVLPANGQSALAERVRLLGIEAPNWQQTPWSHDAKAALEALVGSEKRVVLEPDLQPPLELEDGLSLQLAYVWQNGVLLNERLVEAGLALAVSRSPNIKYEQRLLRAQEKARLMGVGIWNPSNPMRQTPEEFRQQSRA